MPCTWEVGSEGERGKPGLRDSEQMGGWEQAFVFNPVW